MYTYIYNRCQRMSMLRVLGASRLRPDAVGCGSAVAGCRNEAAFLLLVLPYASRDLIVGSLRGLGP